MCDLEAHFASAPARKRSAPPGILRSGDANMETKTPVVTSDRTLEDDVRRVTERIHRAYH